MPPVSSAFRGAAAALAGRTGVPCARNRSKAAATTGRRQCSSNGGGTPSRSSAPSPPKPRRASLLSMYTNLLESRPLATKAVTSGVIAFAGDVSCQVLAMEITKRRQKEQTPMEDVDRGLEQLERLEQLEVDDDDVDVDEDLLQDIGGERGGGVAGEIDWGRTARFTLVGAAVVAPTLHAWYGLLLRWLPGTAPTTVVKRVALDQLLFSPVFLAGFLSTVMLLDGNAAKIEDKLRADYKTTVVSNWGYWIPAQVLNFRFVAPPYQVLCANFVGFFWNIYLSYQSNKEVLKDAHPDGAGVPPRD